MSADAHPLASARFHVARDPVAGVVRKCALDAAGARRLSTEAAALRALDGLGCAPALRSFDGSVLETSWVEGPTLDAWAPAASFADRVAFARGLVEAVAALHARGVVHRDLAPDNVRVPAADRPVLVDFELARLEGHAHGGGTPATAAPELRWLPDPRLLDRRADIYSLGVLLRWLLDGGPLSVTGETLAAALVAQPAAASGRHAWWAAMTEPRRSRRISRLDGLAASLPDGAAHPPPIDLPPLPEAAERALGSLVDDVDTGAQDAARSALLELAPLDGLGMDVPEGSWHRWATDLLRARALVVSPDTAWERADLEIGAGVPWGVLERGGAPAADLALRLDAPEAARRWLGAEVGAGDPVAFAVAAAADAANGDVVLAARGFSAALQAGRPIEAAAARVYWRALARALYHTGSLPDVPRIVLALPHGERGIALAALTPAIGDLVRRADSERRRLVSRADRLRGLVAVALGSSVLQGALVLGEICLWRIGAKELDPLVGYELAEAGRLAAETSPGATGPALSAVAAARRGDAGGVDAALAEARRRGFDLPPMGPDVNAWARAALAPHVEAPPPAWALDDGDAAPPGLEAEPAIEDPRFGPLTTLGQQGLTAALAHVAERLVASPRDAVTWTLALQVWTTVAATDPEAFRRELTVLLDALTEAGLPRVALVPWRMQVHALTGDPAGALAALVREARGVTPAWPAWWLAVRCWLDLGDVAHAEQALDKMVETSAPGGVLGRALEAVRARGGARA